MRGRWLGMVVILSVAGCGGGSGTAGSGGGNIVAGTTGGLVKPRLPKSDPVLTRSILFLGDSITQNGTYPSVVASAVGATAVNAGHSGQKIEGILARFRTDVSARHPDLCVLLCGTNDAFFNTPPAQFQVALITLLNRLHAVGVPVVVVTPPHFAPGLLADGRDLNTSLALLVTILRAEAAQRGLSVAEVNDAAVDLGPDGEHPSAVGQATLAEVITPIVKSALGPH
jgi:lysophospholipase L1-like esterase